MFVYPSVEPLKISSFVYAWAAVFKVHEIPFKKCNDQSAIASSCGSWWDQPLKLMQIWSMVDSYRPVIHIPYWTLYYTRCWKTTVKQNLYLYDKFSIASLIKVWLCNQLLLWVCYASCSEPNIEFHVDNHFIKLILSCLIDPS